MLKSYEAIYENGQVKGSMSGLQLPRNPLIPQPLLPAVGEGEQEIQSPSPLGEGFRVRATKVTCSQPFCWNQEKNEQLQTERKINFETVISSIEEGNLIDIIQHPNQEKYPNQRIFIVEINRYVYLVPFVESDTEFFLKTIIPSRKLKKQYLGE